jgi:hypothetical protein
MPFVLTAIISPALADSSPPKDKPPKKEKLPEGPTSRT